SPSPPLGGEGKRLGRSEVSLRVRARSPFSPDSSALARGRRICASARFPDSLRREDKEGGIADQRRRASSASCHSKRRASCSRLRREPDSLSSARKPGGKFSNTSVTSVPPDTSSNVAVSVISPKKAGSVVTKLTASTILRGGASSTNRTLTMSSPPDVLPRKARSSGG